MYVEKQNTRCMVNVVWRVVQKEQMLRLLATQWLKMAKVSYRSGATDRYFCYLQTTAHIIKYIDMNNLPTGNPKFWVYNEF